jgi:cytochrome c-type biogenesis protein CcmH
MKTSVDVRTWMGLVLLPLAACGDGSAADPAPATAPPSSVAAVAIPPAALPPGHPTVENASDGAIRGTVTLEPAIAAAAREGRALFLIARAGKDRQIVAVKKIDAPSFPSAFELSPQDAMSHGTAFGGALEVTARVSRSGDAAPAAGDVEGVATSVAPGAQDVRIELRSVRR